MSIEEVLKLPRGKVPLSLPLLPLVLLLLDEVYRIAIQCAVIRSFRHKGLERFFRHGTKAGIQPHHAARLRLQLGRLDAATSAVDMNLPGWKWHPLRGRLEGHWAVSVSGNWRLVFTFEGSDAVLVNYEDYH